MLQSYTSDSAEEEQSQEVPTRSNVRYYGLLASPLGARTLFLVMVMLEAIGVIKERPNVHCIALLVVRTYLHGFLPGSCNLQSQAVFEALELGGQGFDTHTHTQIFFTRVSLVSYNSSQEQLLKSLAVLSAKEHLQTPKPDITRSGPDPNLHKTRNRNWSLPDPINDTEPALLNRKPNKPRHKELKAYAESQCQQRCWQWTCV